MESIAGGQEAACPQAPIANANNTLAKAVNLNLYIFAPSRLKFKDDRIIQTERRRELFELFRPGIKSVFNISARSRDNPGQARRTLEDIFQIMVMVNVEPTRGQVFFGTLELPTQKAIFGTGPDGYGQTAVAQCCRLVRKRWGVDAALQQSHYSSCANFPPFGPT